MFHHPTSKSFVSFRIQGKWFSISVGKNTWVLVFLFSTLAIVSVKARWKETRIKYATGNSGAGERYNSRYGVLYGHIVRTLLDQRVKTVCVTGKHIKLYTRTPITGMGSFSITRFHHSMARSEYDR